VERVLVQPVTLSELERWCAGRAANAARRFGLSPFASSRVAVLRGRPGEHVSALPR
jgi:hypothetical protein